MKDTHSLAAPLALNPAVLVIPVALLLVLGLLQGALVLLPTGAQTALVVERVLDSAMWLAGTWLLMRLIDLLIWDRLVPHWLGLRAPRLLRQFVAVMLLLLGVAVLLGRTWGLALSAVLATTGVLGIVLGLALRNILADFFSGIALNIEKPFDLPEHRCAVLAEVPLLQTVSPAERLHLAMGLRVHLLDAGQTAVHEGEPGDSMFVVAEGVLEVRVGQAESFQRANVLGAGSVFGEMALFTGEPRTATVVALGPAVLYELSRSMVAPLLSERPGIADDLAAAIARNRQRDQSRIGAQAAAGPRDSGQQGLARQMAARIRAWLGAR